MLEKGGQYHRGSLSSASLTVPHGMCPHVSSEGRTDLVYHYPQILDQQYHYTQHTKSSPQMLLTVCFKNDSECNMYVKQNNIFFNIYL